MRSGKSSFKFGLVSLLLSGLFISVLTSATVSSAAEESEFVGADFSALQRCMSNLKASLNIVYIMDNSDSMGPPENSDPKNARGPMLQSTLRILQQVGADANRPVNYVMVPFGDPSTKKIAIGQPWRPLNVETLPEEAIRLYDQALQELALGTDWKSGLSVAKDKILKQKKEDQNSCFVAIWLTDGQIDMNFESSGYVKATGQAFRDICENDELINWYRDPDNKVSLLAALLSKNETDLLAGKASKLSPHEKSVLLFEAVVTGKSTSKIRMPEDVISKFGLSSESVENGIYACGDIRKNSNLGLLVKNGDAVDLSWKFVELVAGISGMQVVVRNDGSVPAPNEIGKIQIYVKGPERRELSLIDKEGENVCDLSGVDCSPAIQNGTYTMFTVDLPETGVMPGDLQISIEPKPEELKVYVGLKGKYRELKLVSDHDTSVSEFGEGSVLSREFKVVDKDGNNFEFSKGVKICRTSPVPIDTDCESGSPASFNFSLSVTDENIAATAEIQISGVDNPFKLDLSYPITVFDMGKYAKFDCSAVAPCPLNPIPNKRGKSKTTLTIIGAKKGNSTIKIIRLNAPNDIPERADNYFVSFDPKEVAPIEIQVAEGEEKEVIVYLGNSQAKKKANDVSGTIVYLVSNDLVNDGKEQPIEAPVIFSINQEKSLPIVIIGYLIGLLSAIALPYLALLLQARRSAKFIDEDFRYLTVPVKVSKDGQLFSMSDLSSSESNTSEALEDQVSNDRFVPFETPDRKLLSNSIEIEKGAKELQIGVANLRVKPVRFDAFAPIHVLLSVPDSAISSNQGDSANLLLIETTTADQSLNGLVFMYTPASIVEPVDKSTFQVTNESLDDFASDGPSMSFKSQRSIAESEFIGNLVVTFTGTHNYAKALAKISDLLRSKNFEGLNKSMENLRIDALERELLSLNAVEAKQSSDKKSATASAEEMVNVKSNKSESVFEDEFEDFLFKSDENASAPSQKNDDDEF